MIEILFALKEQRQKVKLCLMTLHGMIERVIGEDSLIGLEMDARKAI